MGEKLKILTDLGNVLIRYDLTPVKKLIDEEKALGVFKKDFDKCFVDLNKGTISLEEFYHFINQNKLFVKELSFPDFKAVWNSCLLDLDRDMYSWLMRLEEKDQVFLLSNTEDSHFSHVLDNWPEIGKLDGFALSYKMNLMKPEREIYKITANRFGLIPEKTIFIDDMKENVEAAEKLGFIGITHKNAEETMNVFEMMKKKGLL